MHSDRLDDEQLIARGLDGDVTALQSLLVRNLPALETFVRLRAPDLIGPRESVGDLAQSTCREVLQDLSRFRTGGPAHFRAWIFETAERKLLHRRRHHLAQKRDVRRLEALESAADVQRHLAGFQAQKTPSHHAEARERLQELVTALDALEEDDRHLVIMARLARVPHRVIAERSDRNEAAVRQALHRALGRLADAIARMRKQS